MLPSFCYFINGLMIKLNLESLLSQRIGLYDIEYLLSLIDDNTYDQELLNLIVNDDTKIGANAAWLMTHLYPKSDDWLCTMQDVLKEAVLSTNNYTKKRLMLNLISTQVLTMHVAFLDFCLANIINKEEPAGIRCLCIKIAYKLCLLIPELLQEFKAILELIESDAQPAIKATQKNITKQLNKM